MVVFCSVLVLLLVVVVALLFASLVEKRRGDDKTALAQGTVAPLQSVSQPPRTAVVTAVVKSPFAKTSAAAQRAALLIV